VKHTKPPPQKTAAAYKQLWRIVDGAVADTIAQHPEYFRRPDLGKYVRLSICKRVVGAVLGYAEQSARGRSR
jgi:hypothetical protein